MYSELCISESHLAFYLRHCAVNFFFNWRFWNWEIVFFGQHFEYLVTGMASQFLDHFALQAGAHVITHGINAAFNAHVLRKRIIQFG